MRYFLFFVLISLVQLSYAVDPREVYANYECSGFSTGIYSNETISIALCHAPYTKISRSRLNEWQNCDDAIIYIYDKVTKKSKQYADCSPIAQKQFKLIDSRLFIRHFYDEYPGFESKPLVIEEYDIISQKKQYKIVAKLKDYSKQDIDSAISLIESTLKKPFHGPTFFDAIYGSFFKLRDYGIKDPAYVLSQLGPIYYRDRIDGEVAETLSKVIEEVKLLQLAK